MMTGKKPLILIVDDDYDFLEISRLVLEKAGYLVVTAPAPDQAQLRMREEKPDLIITDLMMDTLDAGLSFAKTVKEDPAYSDVPIIITTSVSSALGLDFRPRSEADRVAMHVDAYMDKPLEPHRLVDTIARLLGREPAETAEAAAAGVRPAAGGQEAGPARRDTDEAG